MKEKGFDSTKNMESLDTVWVSQANALQVGLVFILVNTHLAKQLSDLKQNGTQEKTTFYGTVFHTLSHDVFHFVASIENSARKWCLFLCTILFEVT